MKAKTAESETRKYERSAPAITARQIGWDGVRAVTMKELCQMAGVGYYQLRLDRVQHSLLEAPLSKPKGVRQLIWSAAAAKRYLRQKNPAALKFN
jgi:hypothetical protein